MKRSKKPLTFAAIAATIGALSLAVEGCVYGPPQEANVYGPPPDYTKNEETVDTQASKPSKSKDDNEGCVYGPAPEPEIDGPEVDVYGPAPEPEIDGPEVDVYGPAPDVG